MNIIEKLKKAVETKFEDYADEEFCQLIKQCFAPDSSEIPSNIGGKILLTNNTWWFRKRPAVIFCARNLEKLTRESILKEILPHLQKNNFIDCLIVTADNNSTPCKQIRCDPFVDNIKFEICDYEIFKCFEDGCDFSKQVLLYIESVDGPCSKNDVVFNVGQKGLISGTISRRYSMLEMDCFHRNIINSLKELVDNGVLDSWQSDGDTCYRIKP